MSPVLDFWFAPLDQKPREKLNITLPGPLQRDPSLQHLKAFPPTGCWSQGASPGFGQEVGWVLSV